MTYHLLRNNISVLLYTYYVMKKKFFNNSVWNGAISIRETANTNFKFDEKPDILNS